MSVYLSNLISGVVYTVVNLMIPKKMFNYEKIKINFSCYIFMILNILVMGLLKVEYRLMLSFFLTICIYKQLYKMTISRATIITLIIYIVCAISEVTYALVYLIVFDFSETLLASNFLVILISNVTITIMYLLFLNIKKLNKIFYNIVKWYEVKNNVNLILLTILSIISILTLLYRNVYSNSDIVMILFNNTFVIGLIFFIISFLKEKTTNNELLVKYDQIMDYAKTFEYISEEQRKLNHEYKNQVIILKGLIENDKKEALNYIEKKIIKDMNSNDSTNINARLKNLPSGGLKGLIFYKIKQMENRGISIYVDINKNMSNNYVDKACKKYLSDISKIIGIFLDNAIEATEQCENKSILFEAFKIKNEIFFVISNTYNGCINLDKIEEKGFSTKGKGRGNGLALVKEVISKNSMLRNEKEFNGPLFVQKLIISTKENKEK